MTGQTDIQGSEMLNKTLSIARKEIEEKDALQGSSVSSSNKSTVIGI